MDNNGNFQVIKMLERAKKRRHQKLLISIVRMVLVLTAISLIFTLFMNVVWASTFTNGKASERVIAVQEKQMPPVPVKPEKKEIEEVDKSMTLKEKEATPSFPYKKHLKLPMEHQKFLYEKCEELDIDFDKALAVMEHESKFDPNAIGETDDYGYFQVNLSNHKWLAKEVGTPNQPLNPEVNIEWGTYMLSHLYDYWTEKGLSGQSLDVAVWSSYNKGITGFKKTGIATEYVSKVKESLNLVKQ